MFVAAVRFVTATTNTESQFSFCDSIAGVLSGYLIGSEIDVLRWKTSFPCEECPHIKHEAGFLPNHDHL